MMTRIRNALKLWQFPVLEARNRILGAAAARRNQRYQRDEVRRLRALTGGGRPLRARVLVVIPTYKRPEGVLKAVQSALSQSYQDTVVVIVDDGAGLPDDLPDDPRLLAVSLGRNTATLGLVRNVGIELGDSEYIAFLDDDNVWTPDHVAAAVAAMDAQPDVGAVYTSVRRLWPDGSELDVLDEDFDRRKLRQGAFVDANSIVVRRACNRGFSVIPRDKSTHPKEDWEYVWRLSRRTRVLHLSKVTVLYAVNPGSYYTTWLDGDGQELGSAAPISPDNS